MAERGFEAASYQAVKWFVVFYIPVIPLGAYRVIPDQGSSPFAGQYLLEPIDWDWRQIGLQYLVGASPAWALSLLIGLSAATRG